MAAKRKLLLTSVIAILASAIIVAQGPIPQDPAYHIFADRRAFCGIPNFWNVISNIPILLCGLIGLACILTKKYSGGLPSLQWHYALFFAGGVLIGLGSSWYHLQPDNNTLV